MKTILPALALAVAGLAPVPVPAQVMAPVLDYATARAISERCIARAREAGHPVAVAVFDQSGELLSFARGDASPAAAEVARWKGRSAAVFRRSTLETGDWNLPTVPMIATIEGGVPLFTTDGVPVGGVGVSGAASEFDAACGTLGAEAVGLRVTRP